MRAAAFAALCATAVLSGTGVALAVPAEDSGGGRASPGVRGCFDDSQGQLRIDERQDCLAYEVPLTWAYVGSRGATGEPGPQGAAGEPGAQGAQGQPGPRGPGGPRGDTGEQGAQGPAGPRGQQGEPGPTGASGSTGPQGRDGTPGAPGSTGPQGRPGGVAGYARRSQAATYGNGAHQLVATCEANAGLVPVGGGLQINDADAPERAVRMTASLPTGIGWGVDVLVDGVPANDAGLRLTVWVVCAAE